MAKYSDDLALVGNKGHLGTRLFLECGERVRNLIRYLDSLLAV